MATPDGKVTFEAGGVTHTLQFTTNALCLLEEKIGKTPMDVATELHFNPPMATIRGMFWAGLGDSSKTLAQIGDLIDVIGKAGAIRIAKKAYSSAFDLETEDEQKEGEGEKNPPVAAAG